MLAFWKDKESPRKIFLSTTDEPNRGFKFKPMKGSANRRMIASWDGFYPKTSGKYGCKYEPFVLKTGKDSIPGIIVLFPE